VAAKIQLMNSLLSSFLRGRGAASGLDGPTVKGRTRQSGAPKTATLFSFPLVFLNCFRSNL
jgi:hypothetical protein